MPQTKQPKTIGSLERKEMHQLSKTESTTAIIKDEAVGVCKPPIIVLKPSYKVHNNWSKEHTESVEQELKAKQKNQERRQKINETLKTGETQHVNPKGNGGNHKGRDKCEPDSKIEEIHKVLLERKH